MFHRAPRKHLHGQTPGLWPLKWTSVDFFQTRPKKISENHDFAGKQTLILVSPLSFKNSDPQSKKKCLVDHGPNQINLRHFTLYNALINKSEQVCIL